MMRIISTVLIVAAAVTAGLAGAAAQVDQDNIVLQEGFSELINIPGEINNVAVGDPEIVDAQPLTSNTFLMNALEQGTTNIIVVDDEGNALYRARIHVRAVEIWPGYPVKVVYGTGLGHAYVCDPVTGCPPRPPRQVAAQPPVNLYLGDTTVNTSATAVTTGQGQSAPAAPAPQ